MIVISYSGLVGDVAAEIARRESLLRDLDAIAAGRAPTAAQLAAAPLIDNWVEGTRPVPCLIGHVTGHPKCRGPLSVTSGIAVWAAERGWMRTESRFYRVGGAHPGGTP